MESVNLEADEAALTGESLPVEKRAEPLPKASTWPSATASTWCYAGTAVTYGRGAAVVVATGMRDRVRQDRRLLQDVETGRTPLQQNLDRVGSLLARAALVVVVLIVALGLVRGQPF